MSTIKTSKEVKLILIWIAEKARRPHYDRAVAVLPKSEQLEVLNMVDVSPNTVVIDESN